MPIEYDLVIIGATELGCRMARQSAHMGARVALVQQSVTPEGVLRYRVVVRSSGLTIPAADRSAWLDLKVRDDASELSVESLRIAGVDYIENAGAFVQTPVHGFQVADRMLRSSHYVSALQGDRIVPLGFAHVEYLTPEAVAKQWFEPSFELKGQRIAIVGEMPVGIELAMALRLNGSEVILIVPTPQILPRFERAFGDRIQMILEVAGVEVWVGKSYDSPSIRDRIAECESIVLATPMAKLLPERLGLRSLNRSTTKQNRLQLMNRRDDLTENIAATVQVAVEKLLKPWWRKGVKLDSGHLAGLDATWVRTTAESKEKPSPGTIELTGMCLEDGRLWYWVQVTRAGTIDAAYFVGDRSMEWSGIFTVAIAAKMSLAELLTLSLPDATQSALASRWLHEWEQHARSPWHEFFLDWLGFVRRRSNSRRR